MKDRKKHPKPRKLEKPQRAHEELERELLVTYSDEAGGGGGDGPPPEGDGHQGGGDG